MKTQATVRFRLFAGVAAVTLAATLLAGAKAQNGAKSADYFPLKVGSTWTLPMKVGNNFVVSVVTVTKVTIENGRTEATLDYWVSEKYSGTEIYQADSKGLMRLASGPNASGKFTPAFPVLQYPLIAGKKWTWKGTIFANGVNLPAEAKVAVSGPETIKTDAGTFSAFHIHTDLTLTEKGQTQNIPNDSWFAPNVGLVKQKTQVGTLTVEATITHYKLEK